MIRTSLLLCCSLFLSLGNVQSQGPGSFILPQPPAGPQLPGTAINPQQSFPSAVGQIGSTGPGAIDTTGPGSIDSTGPGSIDSAGPGSIDSTGPGSTGMTDPGSTDTTGQPGGSNGATQPGLPAMKIPLGKTSSIHFVNVEDGLWDGFNFHYGFHETLENIDDKGCQSACMDDATCVVAVHCVALEDEIETQTTTPAPAPAPGSPFSSLSFNVFNVKSRGQESIFYNCHIFKEVAEANDYTSDDASTWGTNCKYIAINPQCRHMKPPTGWQAIHDPLLDEGLDYLQKYQCDNLRNLSISCDLDGAMTEHGTCTPPVGPSPAAPMPLPIPGLTAPLVGLSNPTFGGFSERLTCAKEPCHIKADCLDTDASVTCTCQEGWDGDGFDCSDENECEAGSYSCGENEECSNTEGGYVCQCVEGHSGTSCEDVDECADTTHNCGEKEKCVNTEGSFTCVCAEGYSGTPCEDENECEAGSYSCGENEECSNTEGGYVCQCVEGHSGTSCEDVDECSDTTHNCGEKEKCVNTEGSFNCVCAEGYSGTPCEDENECEAGSYSCGENEECSNTEGGYVCQCVEGHSGTSCEDVDECADTTHNCGEKEKCVNTEGSFTCVCAEGYSGTPCEDENECEAGSYSCGENEECSNTEGGYVCQCVEGHSGTSCEDVDECADTTHNCGEKEECVNTVGSFTCVCAEGYSGTPCEDVNECAAGSYSCGENEECANTEGGYVCQCVEGHSGTSCEDVDECADTTHNCGEKEKCVNTEGSFTCVCAEGYSGTPCEDVNECEAGSYSCGENEECANTEGGYVCQCVEGYSGTSCEDENECETGSYSCGQNEECEDTEEGYVCQCVEGYSGIPCEDIDECDLVNICPANQKCKNTLGSYNCEQLTGESMCTGEYTYDPNINYCFKLYSSEEKSYHDAKMECLLDGAKLTSLSSALELTSVTMYLTNTLNYLGSPEVWLDGYQTYYGWYEINLWGDGEDIDDMDHWSPYDSKYSSQKCIDIGGYELMFRDELCSTEKDFLCEKSTRTDCVAPFMSDPGHWNCFLILDPMMKSDAASSCPEGSRLALLKSQDQIDMVADYLMTHGIDGGVWVGGKTYSGWWSSYGQWDDNVFIDERYVVPNSIWYDCWVLTLYEDKWLFDDKSCSTNLHAVCERPYPAYTAVGDS